MDQLTLNDRHQIQALNGLDYSARKISINMKRSNKTISQDIGRSKPNKYCAEMAHLDAQQKRQNATKAHKVSDESLGEVERLLSLKMTPEQIAGCMKLETFSGSIGLQAIYRWVHQKCLNKLMALNGKCYKKFKGIEAEARLILYTPDLTIDQGCGLERGNRSLGGLFSHGSED